MKKRSTHDSLRSYTDEIAPLPNGHLSASAFAELLKYICTLAGVSDLPLTPFFLHGRYKN